MYRLTRVILITVMSCIITLGVTSCFDNQARLQDQANQDGIKTNLLEIQIALERYGADTMGIYPADVLELIELGYMDSFPINYYTETPMSSVAFDQASNGDFIYLPVDEGDEVRGYYLMCYGLDASNNLDVNNDGNNDSVIMILSSALPDTPGFPDISEVLEDMKSQ